MPRSVISTIFSQKKKFCFVSFTDLISIILVSTAYKISIRESSGWFLCIGILISRECKSVQILWSFETSELSLNIKKGLTFWVLGQRVKQPLPHLLSNKQRKKQTPFPWVQDPAESRVPKRFSALFFCWTQTFCHNFWLHYIHQDSNDLLATCESLFDWIFSGFVSHIGILRRKKI